jgi:hypothetical protein
MRGRDLNPEETGRAIMRLQAEQSSDFDFPQLIPVERAAELLYGPTGWTWLLRNLHSAWDNLIDFLHMPVHKIEDFTEGELLFTAGGLTLGVHPRGMLPEGRLHPRLVPVGGKRVRPRGRDG